jgi:2-methylcitrate dehydratase
MDDVTAAIAEFSARSHSAALTAEVTGVVVDHVVDALGCAIAAVDERPCRIARTVASAAGGSDASVIGAAQRSTPEHAAFANAALVRYLDFNDTFNSKSGGHPSVMIPGVLASAERAGLSGRDVIQAFFVAAEVYGALCDAVSLRDAGWDAGPFVSAACAAGIGSGLGLEAEAIANAVSLAVTSSVALGVTRSGRLSDWKGCAEAHAVMNAVFVAHLAAHGMTGPARPFDGVNGFVEQVAGPLELPEVGSRRDGRTVIERTAIKFLPVQWTAQAPVELCLGLRERVAVDDILSITISGNEFMCKSVGGGRGDAADKWDPRTRETADHSLPYLVAVALTDGAITIDSFGPERVCDPALRPLMQRVRVVESAETRDLPSPRQPVDVTVELRDGATIREHCEFPRGHPTRPVGSADVDAKFRGLAERVLDAAAASELLTLLRRLPLLPDLDGLTAALRDVPVRDATGGAEPAGTALAR